MTLTVEKLDNGAINLDTIYEFANGVDVDTGAEITTTVTLEGETIRTIRGLTDDFDVAIANAGASYVGDYTSNPTLNNLNDVAYYSAGGTYWKIATGGTTPYTCDSSTYPNPGDDPNLQLYANSNQETSIAGMEARGGQDGDIVFLSLGEKSGAFIGNTTDDLSAQVAADTQQGVYIQGDGIVWVRRISGAVYMSWFDTGAAYPSDKSAEFEFAVSLGKNVLNDIELTVDATVTGFTEGQVIECINGGIFYVGPNMANSKAIVVDADNVVFNLINADNPDEVKSQTDGKQEFISIEANNVTVKHCTIKHMLHAVVTEPTGEWYGSKYLFNEILECIGAGDGSADDTSTYGEDRGDGLLSWGSRNKIIGNHVTAKEGEDCRIGIHVERLEGFETLPDADLDNTDSIIMGNTVEGSFRRHITDEGMEQTVISNNICNKGMTWWGINLVQGISGKTLSNNIVIYDRETTDLTGEAWSPVHAAYYIVASSSTTESDGINGTKNRAVLETDGGRGARIASDGTSNMTNVDIDFNIKAEVATTMPGVSVVDVDNVDISGSRIRGSFEYCLDVFTCSKLKASIKAEGGTLRGARVQDGTGVDLSGSTFNSCLVDVEVSSSSDVTINNTKSYSATNAANILVSNVTGLQFRSNYSDNGAATVSFFGTNTNYALNSNDGYSIDESLSVVDLADATNWINTWSKHKGKLQPGSDGDLYMATGSASTDIWANCSGGGDITPV